MTIVPLGRGGDHLAYLVDDSLVVRFELEPEPGRAAAAVEREAAVLDVAAELSPVPVPRVVFVEPGAGCLAYELLSGVPLLEIDEATRAARAAGLARSLGRLLAALHGAPSGRVAGVVEADECPMRAWLAEAAEHYDLTRAHIPARHRPAVETFLAHDPPEATGKLVFSHNDLGIEHVLVDRGSLAVTGVIDWGDAAMVDPARDFGLLLRDLGPAALEAALADYGADDTEALRSRATFYARAALLEDLAFGLEAARREYVAKSVAGLAWLFPA